MFTVKRSIHNPILVPVRNTPWEAFATFNWSAVQKGKILHTVYRAMSERIYYEGVHLSLSTIGHATSRDQIHFSNRKQFIVPEFDWEKFGCEDARITTLGSKYY